MYDTNLLSQKRIIMTSVCHTWLFFIDYFVGYYIIFPGLLLNMFTNVYNIEAIKNTTKFLSAN